MRFTRSNYVILALLCLCSTIAKGQLIINEVCSKNHNVVQDFEGNSPDFIELYNAGSTSISLSGYRLQDSQAHSEWPLPNVEIEAGEFFLIFASGKDLYVPEYHTNFRISSSGENLFLIHDSQTQLLYIPSLHADHSFGRDEQTGSYRYFDVATPGEHNSAVSFAGYCHPPTLSHETGFYASEINVSCQTIPNQTVLYSTDGHSVLSSGVSVDAPIEISETTVFQFVSTRPDYLPSEVVWRTYFIGEPSNLPVVSLTVEPDTLFDPETGLFMLGPEADPEWPHYGANYWSNRHVDAHLSYFENENMQFSQGCQIRIHGNKGSRNQPQRPLRLVANKKLGRDYFYHPFIPAKSQNRYKNIVLRNGGGDWNRIHFTDAFIQRTVTDPMLDLDSKGSETAVVYINGAFFGVYDFQQRLDENYTRTNLNLPDDTPVTILEQEDNVVTGDFIDFNAMVQWFEDTDLSSESNFQLAGEQVDISNLTDYLISEFFWNNTDWPANNLKYYKAEIEDGKWRWVIYDCDVSMNSVGWVTEHTDNLGRVLNDFQHIKTIKIFLALLENAEYKRYFINRYADLVNTIFAADKITEEFQNLIDNTEAIMPYHFEKWGSNVEWWHFFWIEPRAFVFLSERPAIALNHVEENFDLAGQYSLSIDTWPPDAAEFRLNSLHLDQSRWSGTYFSDIPIDLQAIARPGYRFVHWINADDEQPISQVAAFRQSFDQSINLTAVFCPDDDLPAVLVFPNPAAHSFAVQFYAPSQGEGFCRIYSSSGHLVWESVFSQAVGVNRIELIPDLNHGIYIVEVQSNTFSGRQKLVIKR